MVKAILIKPLDGMAEGAEREFEQDDFDRLEAMGAVRKTSGGSAKAAPAPENKMAPAVENKAADVTAAPTRTRTARR